MSSAAVTYPVATPKAAAEVVDEKLLKAARQLLAGGPVCFKLSTRVKAELLPRWKRRLYVFFCREAPEKLKTPPLPAMQLTVYRSWAKAVAECKGADDQLLVMPFERPYSSDVLDVAVECRPKDERDARTAVLREVFGGYAGGDESTLREQIEELTPDARRLIEKCRNV